MCHPGKPYRRFQVVRKQVRFFARFQRLRKKARTVRVGASSIVCGYCTCHHNRSAHTHHTYATFHANDPRHVHTLVEIKGVAREDHTGKGCNGTANLTLSSPCLAYTHPRAAKPLPRIHTPTGSQALASHTHPRAPQTAPSTDLFPPPLGPVSPGYQRRLPGQCLFGRGGDVHTGGDGILALVLVLVQRVQLWGLRRRGGLRSHRSLLRFEPRAAAGGGC